MLIDIKNNALLKLMSSKEFLIASNIVKRLVQTPTDDELLELYGLYKQSTIGNINIDKPNFLYIKELKKWNAWNSNKDLTVQEAEIKYILYVNQLIQKYGIKVAQN